MDFLFDLALQAGESWSWKGHPPLRRHIEDVVWSDVFEHALVVDRATAKIAGYVSIHSVNLFHGVGYLSVYLERTMRSVSYTHLRAHETVLDLVCRLLLEKKQK